MNSGSTPANLQTAYRFCIRDLVIEQRRMIPETNFSNTIREFLMLFLPGQWNELAGGGDAFRFFAMCDFNQRLTGALVVRLAQ
ncbi:MAG: hypothetical protein KDA91_18300 [Planctomycetaceae bacterium]|nr:hypothetical protein [Planctomycetaceae bacterium]